MGPPVPRTPVYVELPVTEAVPFHDILLGVSVWSKREQCSRIQEILRGSVIRAGTALATDAPTRGRLTCGKSRQNRRPDNAGRSARETIGLSIGYFIFSIHQFRFIARQHAMHAERDIALANPSVCPSVHHTLVNECTYRREHGPSFFETIPPLRNSKRNCASGGLNAREGIDTICDFRPKRYEIGLWLLCTDH